MAECFEPVTSLRGVGPRFAEQLQTMGISTYFDLLLCLPMRYQNRSQVTAIANSMCGEAVLVQGSVLKVSVIYAKKRQLRCVIEDDSGATLTVTFFYFYPNLLKRLQQPGAVVRCYGVVNLFKNSLSMAHPDIEFVEDEEELPQVLTPMYSLVKGVGQKKMQKLTAMACDALSDAEIPELINTETRQSMRLPSLKEALLYLHNPPVEAFALLQIYKHPMQQRVILEELLANQLSLLQARHSYRSQNSFPLVQNDLAKQLLQQLPYQLTGAQQRVINEIAGDLQAAEPMLRLVQGDVGSGKTVVAAYAAACAIASGFQVALMAPTELLAEQHYQNFSRWFEPLGIKPLFLSGRLSAAEKKQSLQQIAEQQAGVVIGTHALFQQQVEFANLALLIIDEQHRFGVAQRLALKQKSSQPDLHPHQLVLTATPIPRTLAMLAYADLDYSVIDELPAGRQPIVTSMLDNAQRAQLIERVRLACEQGKQAYWVCPLIEESEELNAQDATSLAVLLKQQLPRQMVGLLHGRMSADDKEQVMRQFKQGDIDVLVATTVIEVGVDVPNASLMLIENAERFGLAQLHQLRGRVGRGDTQSYCVLLYQSPLTAMAEKRLQMLRDSSDGFLVAQADLELRGAGELLGIRQAGEARFRLADINRDSYLLEQVQQLSEKLLQTKLNDQALAVWLAPVQAYAEV